MEASLPHEAPLISKTVHKSDSGVNTNQLPLLIDIATDEEFVSFGNRSPLERTLLKYCSVLLWMVSKSEHLIRPVMVSSARLGEAYRDWLFSCRPLRSLVRQRLMNY